MTMISDLPGDLLEQILSRLPLKSMRAMRLTCKEWNTLSKNRSFSKMQIEKEEASITKKRESQMIVKINKSLYLMSVINNGDPYIEPKGKLTCLTEEFKVSKVFNCEGLLLCIFEYDKSTKFMLWNPYFLQPRWFEARCSYSRLKGWITCFYGFGYVEKIKNKSCRRSHKILRFIGTDEFNKPEGENFFWYEIYDFESDSWTTLDIAPLWHITFYGFGTTVKGTTYWCVREGNANGMNIISFDFTKERFGPLMHLPYDELHHVEVTLSCVREEKLAALVNRHGLPNPEDLEIWITTEIEAEKLTWSKFLKVNMGTKISCTVLSSFMIDEEKKLVIGSDFEITIIEESGYIRELFHESIDKCYTQYLCAYVPSLVQIKQVARGKRKKQDNAKTLEKRRCHEKMLRLAEVEKQLYM